MYERFTDRGRKVMQLAQQEARRFNHEYIGTEHVLLGLIKEGSGVAANVLRNLHVDLRRVRLEVEKIVHSGPADWPQTGYKLPLTPRVKKVIEFASEEARYLQHNYVGTEHLLLGLIRETEGVASQVLMNLGLRLEAVRAEVLRLLRMPADTEAPPESSRLAYLHELPPHIQPQVQDLLARIDEISVRKVQAVAEQNFELAAQLRDEQERLKQERDALLRVTPQQLPRNLREYEVYVPLVEAQAEKVEAVRQKIVARFEGCLFTRQEVAGRFAVGPIIFDCKHVGVFRFLADEVEHAADFLRQLQEEAVTQLKLGPLAVVEKSASVVL